jgi:hypothetical protein
MSTYGRIGPYCRLCPTKRHIPLSRSVVVEVTKIVDIDRPDSIIIDHVELIVPVLPRRSTPTLSHRLVLLEEALLSTRHAEGQRIPHSPVACRDDRPLPVDRQGGWRGYEDPPGLRAAPPADGTGRT